MNKTILYLEDDEALAFVTKRALVKRGFIVHYFPSIASLQNALSTLTYDAALLDLKIGSDTSLSLISDIKGDSNTPIIILTGYGTIRTAVQAMKLGAIDFLSKPCSVNEIIAAFKEANNPTTNSEEAEIEKPSLKVIEWESIQKALDENDGNISAAARQLKMHRRTLQRKLNKRHIEQ